jgi:hypothetical protein
MYLDNVTTSRWMTLAWMGAMGQRGSGRAAAPVDLNAPQLKYL